MTILRMHAADKLETPHAVGIKRDVLSTSTLEIATATALPNVGIMACKSAKGLVDIKEPEAELVIWQRALPRWFHSWLEELKPQQLPDLHVLVQPADLRLALQPYFEECGMPAGDNRDLLLGDIDDLVSKFAEITQVDLVDVRLECISHDACWKFHRDSVETRLLTTYRGPNTQWVQPKHAARALSNQTGFEGPIEDLTLHDVAIFKGSSTKPGNGIVHRSPPIEGTGLTRLLLCLNKQSITSPDPWPEES